MRRCGAAVWYHPKGMSETVKEDEFAGMAKTVTSLVSTESDRGAILVLAAYLEEILGLIVRAACVTDDDADTILEFRGPAGGFHLKIQLCKALALIHSDEAKALNMVRSIRNSAAHFDSKHGFNVLFDSQAAIARVENLVKLSGLQMLSREPRDVRKSFVICVRLLATRLYSRLLTIRRPSPLPSVKEYANAMRLHFADSNIGRDLERAETEARDGNSAFLFEILGNMPKFFAAISATSNSGAKVPDEWFALWEAKREEFESLLSEIGVQKAPTDSSEP